MHTQVNLMATEGYLWRAAMAVSLIVKALVVVVVCVCVCMKEGGREMMVVVEVGVVLEVLVVMMVVVVVVVVAVVGGRVRVRGHSWPQVLTQQNICRHLPYTHYDFPQFLGLVRLW